MTGAQKPMRRQLNIENTTAISQNMALYYLWHTYVSTNAVKLASMAIESVGASTTSTQAIIDPLQIGVNYMTVIGLAFRLTLALSKTNNSHKGLVHGVFTYVYNQNYVGVLTNGRSLALMISLGLLHNFFVHNQPIANNGMRDYLFKMLLPMLVGYGLDKLTEKLPIRDLVTNKMKGFAMLQNALLWGGLGAPGGERTDLASIQNNIHAGL